MIQQITWRIFADQSITPADVLPQDAAEIFLRRGLPCREVIVPAGKEVDAGEAFGFEGGRDKTAAAFAAIESDAEQIREFGFSAEYFFQLSVKGEY